MAAKKRSKKRAKKSSKKGLKKYSCKVKGSKGGFKIKRVGRKAPKTAKVGKRKLRITCKPRKG